MPALTLVCRRKNLRKTLQRGAEDGALHRREKLPKGQKIGRAQLRGVWRRTNSRRTISGSKLGVTGVLPRRLRCPTAEFFPGKRQWLISRETARATTL